MDRTESDRGSITLSDRTLSRFWAKVDKTGDCWTWTASTNLTGYGKFWDGTRLVGSHRFSFELVNGTIPAGSSVLHRCDNPACVRPDHLFLGTQGDNMQDMIAKGRRGYTGHRGVENSKAKLTPEQVLLIRRQYGRGYTRAELARRFGLSWSNVDRIVNRIYWPQVPPPLAEAA